MKDYDTLIEEIVTMIGLFSIVDSDDEIEVGFNSHRDANGKRHCIALVRVGTITPYTSECYPTTFEALQALHAEVRESVETRVKDFNKLFTAPAN